MKSKMTEIEAQMLLFQDTLNHNEELKQENDQYLFRINEYESRIKNFKMIISERDNEIMKILKEQEKDKLQLKTLIEKNNQLEYSVSLAEFFHKDFI